MKIQIKKIHEDAKIPTKNHTLDEGFDLYSYETVCLKPHSSTLVSTGIAAMCDQNHWLQIEARSGLALKGVHPIGGIIDFGYSGSIGVILMNNNTVEYIVEKNTRIAQIIIRDRHPAEIVEVEQFPIFDRGEKGFGSSGQ